jgi:galactose mutarotase-like enzyme
MSHKILLGSQKKMHCSIDQLGAMVTQCSFKGVDVIHPLEMRGEKKRGGIPICFPFFGPARQQQFEQIAQHGWLRDQQLLLEERSNTGCCATYAGTSGGRPSYPWQCTTTVTHAVRARSLDTFLFLRRHRDHAYGGMPVNPAFHPYFVSHGKRKVWIGTDRYGVSTCGDAQCIPIFDKDDIIIDTGYFQIRMILEGFDYETCLYLWSDAEDYFCVEPVLYPPELFGTEQGISLEKDEIMELGMVLEIIGS